ncbi:hypothetical protein Aperf_G00000069806 [Anoplocephala perfoliata]
MKNNFKEPISSAIKTLRPGLVIEKVKKLLYMWAQQDVFDHDFNKHLVKLARYLDSLGRRPDSNVNKSGVEDLKDFSPEKLVRQLQDYKEIEAKTQVSDLESTFSRFNSPIEATLSRIKSKEEGVSVSNQVEACACQLDGALNDLSRKLAAQEALVKNIDKAMLFYSAQEKDANGVANAYKLYEQQIRETLRSVSGCSYSRTEHIKNSDDGKADGDAEYSCPLTTQTYDDDGVSDMSDVEEVDDIPCSRTETATLSVSDLLVDPRSLSDLPFNEYIAVDDQGDVDYRPMFSKIIENNVEKAKIKSEEAVAEVKPNELPPVSSKTVLTESGDFDYRKPVVMDEDQRDPSQTDPFGLGTRQDADLRQLEPLLSGEPSTCSSPPAVAADSDYRRLPPPHLPSNSVSTLQALSPPTTSSFAWLNSADSDLRQSPPVKTEAVDTSVPNPSLPFTATLPPPRFISHLSITVPPAIHVAVPPPITSKQTCKQQQKQQTQVSTSEFPDIPATLLSTLRRISHSSASTLSNQSPAQLEPSSYTFASQADSGRVDFGAVKSEEVAKPQQEDPFSIISRLTGLSNLIQSVRATPTRTPMDGDSPVTPRTKASADAVQTPTYSEGLIEGEKITNAGKPTNQASSSPLSATQQQSVPEAEDGDQSDGGATPTQDESENPIDVPVSTGHFTFSQAELSQLNFPPPPLQTTPGASNNLLLNLPPMGLPPTFNPLGIGQGQPPWQTSFPPGLTNLGGRTLPTQAFFPVFPPLFNRPPTFPNFPNSQSNQ